MGNDFNEMKRDWARRWAHMRNEYLAGKLLDVIVFPMEDGTKFRWECAVCGAVGKPITSEKLTLTAGRGHMNTHVSKEDQEALEDMKVLNMPEPLLTNFQRFRRSVLEAEQRQQQDG